MITAADLLGATSSTKSSGSSVFLIVLVGIVAAVYFLFLRPQQQKQKQQRAQQGQAEVGDEVLTVGGIVGRVVDISGDRVTIVSGEGSEGAVEGGVPTRIVLLRQGIARKIPPVVADDDLDLHDHEHDDHDHEHDDGDDLHLHDEDHGEDHDPDEDGPPKGSRER